MHLPLFRLIPLARGWDSLSRSVPTPSSPSARSSRSPVRTISISKGTSFMQLIFPETTQCARSTACLSGPDRESIPGVMLVGPRHMSPWETKPEFGSSADADALEEICADIRWANADFGQTLKAHARRDPGRGIQIADPHFPATSVRGSQMGHPCQWPERGGRDHIVRRCARSELLAKSSHFVHLSVHTRLPRTSWWKWETSSEPRERQLIETRSGRP